MTIEWTTERVASWSDGQRSEHDVRVARRWRIRAISDRADHRVGAAPATDFVAIVDRDLELWIRPFGAVGSSTAAFERRAGGPGVDLEIVDDITLGLPHDVAVQVRPSDETIATWSCSCGTGSRGTLSPELAREAADLHAATAPGQGIRRADVAVAQGEDGAWAQRAISAIRRFRACARSDFSVVKMHQLGYGEEFELVVDSQLGLWVRRLAADTALRRDESGRGVSLLISEVM